MVSRAHLFLIPAKWWDLVALWQQCLLHLILGCRNLCINQESVCIGLVQLENVVNLFFWKCLEKYFWSALNFKCTMSLQSRVPRDLSMERLFFQKILTLPTTKPILLKWIFKKIHFHHFEKKSLTIFEEERQKNPITIFKEISKEAHFHSFENFQKKHFYICTIFEKEIMTKNLFFP